MNREYKVEVIRDGRWWMINVPEIEQITQARRIGEIEDMARSLIAISTDTPITDVRVHVANINIPGIGDILGRAHRLEELRRHAEQLEAEIATEANQFASELTRADVPVRDAAVLLGVSPQRVSQLVNSDQPIPRANRQRAVGDGRQRH